MNTLTHKKSVVARRIAAFFMLLLVGCMARQAAAQTELYTFVSDGLTGLDTHGFTNTTDLSLTDGTNSPYDSASLEVQPGSAHVQVLANMPVLDQNLATLVSTEAGWSETVTINNPDHLGEGATARFTVHLDGNMSSTQGCFVSGAGGGWSIQGDANYSERLYDNGYTEGDDLSTVRTFTADVPFSYGTPFTVAFELGVFETGLSSGLVNPPGEIGDATFTGDFTLHRGNFVVLDGDNESVDFSAETSAGTATATNLDQGDAYAGFAVTNDVPGRFDTAVAIVDGAATDTNETLTAAFVAPPSTNTASTNMVMLASDPVEFSGTDTNLFAIQLSFDPAAAAALLGGQGLARLAWLEPVAQKWLNAVAGNSAGTVKFVAGPYDASVDFHLGYFGLDLTNHVVWAVLNHNSEFAVAAVPDPVILRILSLTQPSAHAIHLLCTGVVSSLHQIQSTTDLTIGFTNEVSVMADTNGFFEYDDTNASGQQKFYRLAHP